MILWLNGAFGSGKSSVAEAIRKRVRPSFIYDPEQAGYFLWDNFPEELARKGNFQHLTLWRELNYKILKHLDGSYAGTVIVPMTLYIKRYYDEIVGALMRDGVSVRHFILAAPKQTILDRLAGRGDSAGGWAAEHIDACLKAFETEIFGVKIVTENRTVDAIAAGIISLSGLAV